MKIVIFLFMASVATACFAVEPLPCVVARESVEVSVPGYNNESGAKQPAAVAAIGRCLTRHRICLLLSSGKIVAGSSEAEASVTTKSVVFGVVQTLRTKSRSYCAFGTYVSSEDGYMFWGYRTFTPNGGWIGEELYDQMDEPMTSKELYGQLAKNFQLFQAKLRQLLSEPSFKDGEFGLHVGEEP